MSEYKPNPEIRLTEKKVTDLSPAELFELKIYLNQQRINIKQKKLQEGIVTAGYAKFGAIQFPDGKIAFRPNQNNFLIVGTPEEFLHALKIIDPIL